MMLYARVLQKGIECFAFLPKKCEWSAIDYHEHAPEALKPLFVKTERPVFKFTKYYHEEDQQIAELNRAVRSSAI